MGIGQAVSERFFSNGLEFSTETAACQYGELMGSEVTKEVRRSDPVFSGVYRYVDGGWDYHGPLPGRRPVAEDSECRVQPPVCSLDCRYRQQFSGFDLQRNALRSELASMVDSARCGWNLKPGHLGGRPLDYAPCILSPRH